MSEIAVAEPTSIVLTREEYEQLRAGSGKKTVTVDAEEYAAAMAAKAQLDKQQATFDRTTARLRELETMLQREQREHAAECEQMLKRIKQLGG